MLGLCRKKLVQERDVALLHRGIRIRLRTVALERHVRTHIHLVAQVLKESSGHVVALEVASKLLEILRVPLLRRITFKYHKAAFLRINLHGVLLVACQRHVGQIADVVRIPILLVDVHGAARDQVLDTLLDWTHHLATSLVHEH